MNVCCCCCGLVPVILKRERDAPETGGSAASSPTDPLPYARHTFCTHTYLIKILFNNLLFRGLGESGNFNRAGKQLENLVVIKSGSEFLKMTATIFKFPIFLLILNLTKLCIFVCFQE